VFAEARFLIFACLIAPQGAAPNHTRFCHPRVTRTASCSKKISFSSLPQLAALAGDAPQPATPLSSTSMMLKVDNPE